MCRKRGTFEIHETEYYQVNEKRADNSPNVKQLGKIYLSLVGIIIKQNIKRKGTNY